MAAYADADDLIARYDTRILGDLVNDSGERITEAELSGNSKITTALEGASGELNANVLRGNRYSVSDISALTGNDLVFLKDIICTLAFARLYRRRSWVEISDSMKESMEYAERKLKALGNGEVIFNIEDTRNAGAPSVTAVSRVEITRDWELVADKCRGHIYPQRRSYRNG